MQTWKSSRLGSPRLLHQAPRRLPPLHLQPSLLRRHLQHLPPSPLLRRLPRPQWHPLRRLRQFLRQLRERVLVSLEPRPGSLTPSRL